MNRKELFERLFKADLLSMVSDPVSNVRLALAKVLRHHFISQINGNSNLKIIISIGAFVFDIDVNDAVRILKTDAKVDVRQLVQDIQTFPMNEGDNSPVDVKEFLERISVLNQTRSSSISTQDEQDVERHAHIKDIMKDIDQSVAKHQNDAPLRTSVYGDEVARTLANSDNGDSFDANDTDRLNAESEEAK